MTSFASYHVPHGTRLPVDLEPGLESLGWLNDGSKTQMLISLVKNDDVFLRSRNTGRARKIQLKSACRSPAGRSSVPWWERRPVSRRAAACRDS